MYQDKSKKELISPKVKDVLFIVGAIGLVSAIIVFPNLPMALKPLMDYKRKKEYQDQQKLWKKYNPRVLRHLLKRLEEQKDVQFITENGETLIKLTDKGRVKLLKYNIDNMTIEDKSWDGKWRLIIYDIPDRKRTERDIFRRLIKKMEIFQLQESVYLTPYKCDKEIEYIRRYFGVGQEVIYLTLEKLENDHAYRQYFAL